MKITLVLDGERREVEVDLDRHTVRVGDREWPVEVGESSNGGVTFEILGERVEVHGDPLVSVTVNGELHSVSVEARSGATPRPTSSHPASAGTGASSSAEQGPGRAVLPPMPGKVLEVRVTDGDQVTAGQVLLVIEAMKMRNEVSAPVAGTVTALRARPGANVTAREVLLRLLPG